MNDLDARIGKLTEEFFDKIQELKEELKQENNEYFDIETLTSQMEDVGVAYDTTVFDSIVKQLRALNEEDKARYVSLFNSILPEGWIFVMAYYLEMGIQYERAKQTQTQPVLTDNVLV